MAKKNSVLTEQKQAPGQVFSLGKAYPNRFLLSAAIAKRARQIYEGAEPLVPSEENAPPILIAIEELKANKLEFEIRDEKELDEDLMNEMADLLNNDEEEKEPEKEKVTKDKTKSKSLSA